MLQSTITQHHGCQADQRPGAWRSQPSAQLEADAHQGAGRHLGFPHAEVRGSAGPWRDSAALPAPHRHDPGDDADGQAGQAGRGHGDAQDTPTGSCCLCVYECWKVSKSLIFTFLVQHHNISDWFAFFFPPLIISFCILMLVLTPC